MNLNFLSRTKEVVSRLSEMFLQNDREHFEEATSKITTLHLGLDATCIGFAELQDINTKEGKERIYVILDESYWENERPLDTKRFPMVELVKLFDGECQLRINEKSLEWYTNPTTTDVIYGDIAHEFGHLISGHLSDDRKEELEKQKENKDVPWEGRIPSCGIGEAVIVPLLEGYYGDALELEADIEAVRLVGLSPVLATHAITAEVHHNIGVRLQHNNRVGELLRILRETPERFSRNEQFHLNIVMLTRKQLEEI